jgi:hypothetical protein
MAVNDKPLGASGSTLNDLGNMGALTPILGRLAGGSKGGQMAIDFAQQMYPDPPKADPYEAALQFFLAMGQGASQPGATVLGSAVGAMQAPADYLAAKKKEKRETDQARMQAALSLAPSLKPPTVKTTYGKPDFYMISRKQEDGTFSEPVETALTPKQFSELPTDGSVKITSVPDEPSNKNTYKEQKFYKKGFPAAVVKNETDVKAFKDAGWETVPPEGWTEELDGEGFETQSSQILPGGIIVFAGKGGSAKVLNAATREELTGEAAKQAIADAYKLGAETQGDRSQARGLGSEAAKAVTQSFKEMLKVRNNIATLEDAKRALEGGAQTGYFAQFLPDISRSAVELQNVRLRLGLDVVSSVTFGALSEKELEIALDTGLPESMDEGYLKKWVQERIDAKKKLLVNLQDAAEFLSQGNSIGDWVVELRKRETKKEEEVTPLATELSTMSAQNINKITPEDLAGYTKAELRAYLKRQKELKGQ